MDLLAIIMAVLVMVTVGGIPGFGLVTTAAASKHGTWRHVLQGVGLSVAGVVSFWGTLAAGTGLSIMIAETNAGLALVVVFIASTIMAAAMIGLIYVGEKISDKITAKDDMAFTNAMLSRYMS